MGKLATNARKKLRMALRRVVKVVIMETRNNIEQQRKWKAKVMAGKRSS